MQLLKKYYYRKQSNWLLIFDFLYSRVFEIAWSTPGAWYFSFLFDALDKYFDMHNIRACAS